MGCEDCENYKPKANQGFQKTASQVNAALYEFCGPQTCTSCPLGEVEEKCGYTRIKEIIRKAGADI